MSTFAEPDHPDPGVVLGYFTAPAWAIALVGLTIVLGGIGYFVWRARQSRRRMRWPAAPTRGR